MATEPAQQEYLELNISNDMSELARLTDDVHAFSDSHQLASQTVYAIDFVLEELVTNVIKYAYDDTHAHAIQIRLELRPDAIIICLKDDGREFDPANAPEPDTSAPLEERQIGGLGLFMVRDMVTSMRYTREDGTNRLDIQLPRPSASTAHQP